MTKKRVEYLQCPMCGWIRPERYRVEVRFDKVDVKNVLVWQVKEVGGRGCKFEVVDGRKLKELPIELKQQIRTQANKILEELR